MHHDIPQTPLTSVLHWNMAFVGGFLGTYALTLHSNFGSAQTSNVMKMAIDLTSFNFSDVGIRLLAMLIFGLGIVLAHLTATGTALDTRRLVLLVDAVGLTLAALLPQRLDPVVGLYPIYFCAAFQWGTDTGIDGHNSASIFITNNFKQTLLNWTQYIQTKDTKFRTRAVLYSLTVVAFFAGACVGALCTGRFGAYGAFAGFVPLLTARLFIALDDRAAKMQTSQNHTGGAVRRA